MADGSLYCTAKCFENDLSKIGSKVLTLSVLWGESYWLHLCLFGLWDGEKYPENLY